MPPREPSRAADPPAALWRRCGDSAAYPPLRHVPWHSPRAPAPQHTALPEGGQRAAPAEPYCPYRYYRHDHRWTLAVHCAVHRLTTPVRMPRRPPRRTPPHPSRATAPASRAAPYAVPPASVYPRREKRPRRCTPPPYEQPAPLPRCSRGATRRSGCLVFPLKASQRARPYRAHRRSSRRRDRGMDRAQCPCGCTP